MVSQKGGFERTLTNLAGSTPEDTGNTRTVKNSRSQNKTSTSKVNVCPRLKSRQQT